MRHYFFIFTQLLFLFCAFYEAKATQPIIDSELSIEIKKKDSEDFGGRPRTVCGSEIEAVYNLGLLTITFNENLGDADIEVVNCSTGEAWFDVANGICSLTFALSNDPGTYIIYITTDQGLYQGSFILY